MGRGGWGGEEDGKEGGFFLTFTVEGVGTHA